MADLSSRHFLLMTSVRGLTAGSNIMYLSTPRLPLRVLLQKHHKAKALTRRHAQASAVRAVYGWVRNVEHMDNNESLN